MFTLGTAFVFVGLAGLLGKAWSIFINIKDPPCNFKAEVAKIRLDTKKGDGLETYTYIVTFYIHEKQKYMSFQVSQKQFDEIIEKDNGVLTCNFKREKFINWEFEGI